MGSRFLKVPGIERENSSPDSTIRTPRLYKRSFDGARTAFRASYLAPDSGVKLSAVGKRSRGNSREETRGNLAVRERREYRDIGLSNFSERNRVKARGGPSPRR